MVASRQAALRAAPWLRQLQKAALGGRKEPRKTRMCGSVNCVASDSDKRHT